MNVFFKINGEIVTSALQGSILGGITRKSCIELLKSWGTVVNERRVSIREIADAADAGKLEEAFRLRHCGSDFTYRRAKMGQQNHEHQQARGIGSVSQKLYDELTVFSGATQKIRSVGPMR